MTPEHEIKILKRRLELSRKYWLRAAKAALNGDMKELRLRVEMCEAEPLEIRLSGFK